jgi:predicted nucleic acid-binding protein
VQVALSFARTKGGTISVQVLNEIANVGAARCGETHGFLEMLRDLLPVVLATVETHEAGIALVERYGFSIYDAMIAASAILSGRAVWALL